MLGNKPQGHGPASVKEVKIPAKDYSKDFPWVVEFIDNKDGVLPLTAHHIKDTLHIQGYGSALVLLSDGRWFMTDTSGG